MALRKYLLVTVIMGLATVICLYGYSWFALCELDNELRKVEKVQTISKLTTELIIVTDKYLSGFSPEDASRWYRVHDELNQKVSDSLKGNNTGSEAIHLTLASLQRSFALIEKISQDGEEQYTEEQREKLSKRAASRIRADIQSLHSIASSIVSEQREEMRTSQIYSRIFILVILVPVVFFIGRLIIKKNKEVFRSLQILEKGVKAIKEEEWAIKLPSSNILEFNIVIDAFNEMAKRIDFRILSEEEAVRKAERNQRLAESLLAEKNLLLAEIHHRVKNNLAIISGLLWMELQEVEDQTVAAPIKRSIGRINSMSQVHELIYGSPSFSSIPLNDYMEALKDSFKKNFQNSQVTIQIDSEAIKIGINTAIPLGMLLNELLAQSYNHALAKEAKTVTIRIKETETYYQLLYHDDGSVMGPHFNNVDGEDLGVAIIYQLIAQLNGEFEIGFEDGFNLVLTFTEREKGSASSFDISSIE